MKTRDQRGKYEKWCQEALPLKSRGNKDILAEFKGRREEASKKKKLDFWENFQEIGSLTYLERLARNLKLEGYFGKVVFYKVEKDSKPYWYI